MWECLEGVWGKKTGRDRSRQEGKKGREKERRKEKREKEKRREQKIKGALVQTSVDRARYQVSSTGRNGERDLSCIALASPVRA